MQRINRKSEDLSPSFSDSEDDQRDERSDKSSGVGVDKLALTL